MTTFRIDTSKAKRWSFEMGPIRPPSEGRDRSLLIRATRNCPWNRCRFCTVYKSQKFQYRSPSEIKEDIDAAMAIANELKAASWTMGLAGKLDNSVLRVIVAGTPELYAHEVAGEDADRNLQSLINVANWLASGGRTAFLQDADTLIMRTPDLLEVLHHLKECFPSIERVTSYARSKTASRKTLDELKALHSAGLSRLHIGLESGADEVLDFVQKGVTAEEHIAGGRKVVEAGITLSEYVMPGLGGKRWSQENAWESARVLNAISPHFVRIRSLMVGPICPLYADVESGKFQMLTEDETVAEIGTFVANLECRTYLASDQMVNLLWEVEGKIPEDKEAMLGVVASYLSRDLLDRLSFRLERRRRSFYSVYGGFPPEIQQVVKCAEEAIAARLPSAPESVDAAISGLKRYFI